MHGEYKMPGGKLIVAEFLISDGHLTRVQISGDFFLEPDEALDRVNSALEGLPADTPESTMVATIAAALPDHVVMYGISSEAVAAAVVRALESDQ